MQIIPTIFEKEFRKAQARIRVLEQSTKWIQIDVSDDVFTPGKTFELELLSKAETEKVILWDIHLMVKEPEKWLEKCLFVGASRVSGHVEMMSDREAFVKKAKDMGMEAGLAFNIGTPVDNNIPEETDLILLMGRPAGFMPAKFDEKVFKKIDPPVGGCHYIFGIDGGVDISNIQKIIDSGIEIAYSGSSYYDLIGKNVI